MRTHLDNELIHRINSEFRSVSPFFECIAAVFAGFVIGCILIW